MKKRIIFVLSLLSIFTLSSCKNEYSINEESLKIDSSATKANQTFYEVFVGGFSDSNGDGIGDLRGLINRLDYLNDGDPNSGRSLGVTGLWLMPIFKSPSYHKYDVIDYYSVDSSYGTNDDLKELATECHKRGITLIVDLPINHTSSSSQWFINFRTALRNGDFSNQYAEYYSYCDEGSGLAGRTTAPLTGTAYKYECNFSTSMPELNFDSDLVREETLNIAKYWMNLGIDGFRFDAAKYIYFESSEKSVSFWNWYMSELKKVNPDVYCVAEVWDNPQVIQQYYSAFTCFDFAFSQADGYIAKAAKGGNVNSYINQLINYYNNCSKVTENPILAPFIANHDTDRAAGYLPVSTGDAYSAAGLLLMTPGTPFIYYGEEIGMKGSRGGANTDANRRLAMLWGDDDTVKDPVGATYSIDNQKNGTVASQISDKNSLYNHYKKLIMMRNANKEIANGKYTAVTLGNNNSVGGFIATLNNHSCLVIHNTSSEAIEIDLSNYADYKVINSFSGLGEVSLKNNMLTIGHKTVTILRKD